VPVKNVLYFGRIEDGSFRLEEPDTIAALESGRRGRDARAVLEGMRAHGAASSRRSGGARALLSSSAPLACDPRIACLCRREARETGRCNFHSAGQFRSSDCWGQGPARQTVDPRRAATSGGCRRPPRPLESRRRAALAASRAGTSRALRSSCRAGVTLDTTFTTATVASDISSNGLASGQRASSRPSSRAVRGDRA